MESGHPTTGLKNAVNGGPDGWCVSASHTPPPHLFRRDLEEPLVSKSLSGAHAGGRAGAGDRENYFFFFFNPLTSVIRLPYFIFSAAGETGC